MKISLTSVTALSALGLLGRIYCYALPPFHGSIFKGVINKIEHINKCYNLMFDKKRSDLIVINICRIA